MKVCDAPGCSNPARYATALYCEAHRQRLAKRGTLELLEPRPVEERLWMKVTKTDTCWLWTGATTQGYGRIGLGRRGEGLEYVHRLAYRLLVGPIPAGLEVDHVCLVRNCVNPEHLQAITKEENSGLAKRRWTHCPRGHEFTAENTYWRPEGRRMCRSCTRDRRRHVRAEAA